RARGHLAARLQDQAAGACQDVRLVHQRDAPPAARLGELEGVLDDPLAAFAGDDADRLGRAALLVDVVLDARVETLGVLADHYQVDAGVPRLHAGEAARRPHVGVEVELLAQGDVHAAEAFAARRR